jgi:prephenate dehydrogenase
VAEVNGPHRAAVIGTGLIGGSIGMALRRAGWHVSGTDAQLAVAEQALEVGAIDAVGIDPGATITFVAAPVRAIAPLVHDALAATTGAVTDVGSVKGSVVRQVSDPRFVGGHPMAGSEQLGLAGSDPDMFAGAVWVLTPTETTDPAAHATVRSVVRTLGAEVVELAPERHDALVAVVSHVPHLTAAALMTIADQRADEHAALLRLAAGGFRDMTRVAAGTPSIWPDICGENDEAIVGVIDELTHSLAHLRALVAAGDRSGLLDVLRRAQDARRNLPSRAVQPDALVELRVPILDRPGGIAEVSTLAAEMGVNISDLEIAHSSEGDRGVLILLVDRQGAEGFRSSLADRGYRATVHPLA